MQGENPRLAVWRPLRPIGVGVVKYMEIAVNQRNASRIFCVSNANQTVFRLRIVEVFIATNQALLRPILHTSTQFNRGFNAIVTHYSGFQYVTESFSLLQLHPQLPV
jgi:hypothetical protein